MVICCRTEYLEVDDTKWFRPKVGGITKKYIAPIDYKRLDLKEYIARYVNLIKEKSEV